MYDPQVGRWLTEDPSGFADGPNASIYVHNNPVTFVDPNGLDADGNVIVDNIPGHVHLKVAKVEGKLFNRQSEEFFATDYLGDTVRTKGNQDVGAKFGVSMTAEYKSTGAKAPAHWVQFKKDDIKKKVGENEPLEPGGFDWEADGSSDFYPHQRVTDNSAIMVDHPGVDLRVPFSWLDLISNAGDVSTWQVKTNPITRNRSISDWLQQTQDYQNRIAGGYERKQFQTYLVCDSNKKPVGYFEWSFEVFYPRSTGPTVVLKAPQEWKEGVDPKVWPGGK